METFLEIAKTLTPLALAYVALLKTRTELDILWAKQRGGPKFLRRKWYHVVKRGSVRAFEEQHKSEAPRARISD